MIELSPPPSGQQNQFDEIFDDATKNIIVDLARKFDASIDQMVFR